MSTVSGDDIGVEAEDMSTRSGPEPDMNACVPTISCPPDACGARADGCGGELDCGPCVCVVAPGEVGTCGPCGLGRATCDDGVAECTLPELPDEIFGALRDSCDVGVLYVDHNQTLDETPTGSKERPFATLEDAMKIAKFGGISAIVLSRGTHIGEFLRVPDGTSIIGGFQDGFIFNPASRSELRFSGRTEGSMTAVLIEENRNPAALANLTVRLVGSDLDTVTADYLAAIRIKGSEKVWLSHVEAYSGDGVDGADGSAGATGEAGPKGGDAYPFVQANNLTVPPPGRPTMQLHCDGAEGGAGGEGAPAHKGSVGSPGEPSPGGAPGGIGGSLKLDDANAGPGGMGSTGDAGADGMTGAHGSSRLLVDAGELVLDGHGADGHPGAPGIGGGGGGGAASFARESDELYVGGSGGAGGSGGCGGAGGGGGRAGQSTFGLFVSSSQAIVVTNSIFGAGSGGDGGQGGEGGSGGAGGAVGLGTNRALNPLSFDILVPQIMGGHGGGGGQGGRGGDGGAGAGGASVGAFCEDPISVDDATDFRSAGAGVGGAPGLDGVSESQVGCLR